MSQATIGTAATLLIPANTERLSVIISVIGDGGLFLDENSTMTTSDGILVAGSSNLTEDSGGQRVYLGPYYGATSSGTTEVRYWERTRK